mmetsp:Transcript_10577/g.19209  ORF Transcript_10577/g.19209 Transcript_10577/m.19209 type:complete len:122 (-) Transcript_10577:210-575(-)
MWSESMNSIAILSIALTTTGGGGSRRQSLCNAEWVDPDSPVEALTTTAHYAEDTREYELVFSDEFEQDGRSFEDGADPRWTAIDKNDCAWYLVSCFCHFYLLAENISRSLSLHNLRRLRNA